MKHRVFGKSNLGRKTSHRDSLFRTMVTQLIQHEGMQTTTVKMKRLRPIADKMVTLAKGGTLHHRRQALAYLKDKDVVRKLFAEFPARYATRHGGYTTFVRLPNRAGDNAPMCWFMFVDSFAHRRWMETYGPQANRANSASTGDADASATQARQ